jgi:hypothetical protein
LRWRTTGALSRLRTSDTDELAGDFSSLNNGCMNPMRQRTEIGIDGANNDSGMIRSQAMEPDEMFSVQRQHAALLCHSVCQYLFVAD